MTQCLYIAVGYVEYGSGLKLYSLKLEIVIDTGITDDTHGTTTSLISYNTPFIIDGSPLIITFGLCDNVSLHVVLSLPILLLYASLNFTTINKDFILYI